MTITFQVNDMTCGHCVGAITHALQAADPGARIQADLASRRVQVAPATAGAEALAAAIREAGYTPVPASTAEPAAPQARGSCCGCR